MDNLKLLGVLCIIGGCGTLGLMQSARKRRRLQWLKDLEWHLRILQQKILQLHMPLALALQPEPGTSSDEVARLFEKWGNLLQKHKGMGALTVWKILRQQNGEMYLEPEDWRLLEKLVLQVGQGSEAEEKRRFEFFLNEVNGQQERAREKIRSECRLFGYGGFMLGITMVLLLI